MTRNRVHRRGAALLVLLTLPLTVGAARAPAATSTPQPALTTVTAAVAKTLAAGTATVQLRLSNGEIFGKKGHALSGKGQYSFVDALGVLRLRPDLIFAVAELYVHQPALPATDTAARPWTFVDLSASELREVKYQGLLAQAESINPLLIVQLPVWGGVKAAASGSSSSGSQTFVVTVDLGRAAVNATGPVQAPFVKALGQQAGRRRRIPVTVTVDRAGRVSRVSYAPPGVSVGTASLLVSGFGSPVDVHVPPKEQVTDLVKVLENAEGEKAGSGETGGS